MLQVSCLSEHFLLIIKVDTFFFTVLLRKATSEGEGALIFVSGSNTKKLKAK